MLRRKRFYKNDIETRKKQNGTNRRKEKIELKFTI